MNQSESTQNGTLAHASVPAHRLHTLGMVPKSERVLIDDRPHIAFVFSQMYKWFILGIISWGVLRWFGISYQLSLLILLSYIALLLVFVRWVIGLIDWNSRHHILTDSRLIARSGILRTISVDLPLRRVQHMVLVRPFAERFFGIGSIGVTSAGTGGVDLVWRGVEHPQEFMAKIREQVDRMSVQNPSHGQGKQVTPIIGIVGGIGAGKSSVARVFESIGCVVSDSDASVRAVLKDTDVISTLKSWWGDQILHSDGSVDRQRIAELVFENEFDRRRLEGLVHPRVHESRRQLITQAVSDGVAGVIIDAPLLFEAGVDSECDSIVFVDTPREIRQARVQKTRGWSADELDKREKTQLGLEHKRKRSDYIVANSGSPEELHGRVSRVLSQIQKDLQQRIIG